MDKNDEWVQRLREAIQLIESGYYSHERVAEDLAQIADEIRNWQKPASEK
jgi:hypothetical protein